MATPSEKKPRIQMRRRLTIQKATRELNRLKAQVGKENKPAYNFTPKYTEADFQFSNKTADDTTLTNTSDMFVKRDHEVDDRKETDPEIKCPPLFYKRKVQSIIGAGAAKYLGLLEEGIEQRKADPKNNEHNFATEMNCALTQAVSNKSPTMVETLLKLGADPSAFKTWYPVTLSAADSNCEEIVDIFLARGLDFSHPCPYGSALHSAARQGNVNIMKKMIAANLDVNSKNEIQEATPLHVATQLRRKDAVELLLQSGASVNQPDSSKRTALHFAAMQGADDIADLLLKAGGDIGGVDKDNKTPWMHAALNMHTATAEKLLALERDIHKKVFDGGATYLHLACAAGLISCCEYLLQKGANLAAKDDQGNTPLMVAVKNTRAHVVSFLLAKDCFSCQVNHQSPSGNSALSFALEKDYNFIVEGMLKSLRKAGADPNMTSGDGQHLLVRYVGQEFCKKKVEWLLTNGADMNVVPENHETVLWHAVKQSVDSGNLDLVNLILAKNVDIRISALASSNDDTTPLTLAMKSASAEVSDVLFHSGCSLNGLPQWLKTEEAKSLRDNDTQYDSLCKAIELKLKNRTNLQDICRLAVLATLGHDDVSNKMCKLEVPALVKQYMELETYQRVSRLDFACESMSL